MGLGGGPMDKRRVHLVLGIVCELRGVFVVFAAWGCKLAHSALQGQ